MKTGVHLWRIPNGVTPDNIANHPLLEGSDIPNTGFQGKTTALVTGSLLMFAAGRGGRPIRYAVDKLSGERLASIEIPAPVWTAPMTCMHEGVQYIVLPLAGDGVPGSLLALRLPRGGRGWRKRDRGG